VSREHGCRKLVVVTCYSRVDDYYYAHSNLQHICSSHCEQHVYIQTVCASVQAGEAEDEDCSSEQPTPTSPSVHRFSPRRLFARSSAGARTPPRRSGPTETDPAETDPTEKEGNEEEESAYDGMWEPPAGMARPAKTKFVAVAAIRRRALTLLQVRAK
jgi:hypothetical protein